VDFVAEEDIVPALSSPAGISVRVISVMVALPLTGAGLLTKFVGMGPKMSGIYGGDTGRLFQEGGWLCCFHQTGYRSDAGGAENGDIPAPAWFWRHSPLRPGSAVCSGDYVDELKSHGFGIRMARAGNPLTRTP